MYDHGKGIGYEKELLLEENCLKATYGEICVSLEQRQKEVDSYNKSIVSANRAMWRDEAHTWERGDTDVATQIKQSLDLIKQGKYKQEIALIQLKKLTRLKKSAYFGRVDFMEERYNDLEQIYIGVSTFFNDKGDILIYDWRAPISSIFYDYELASSNFFINSTSFSTPSIGIAL